jgi:hypothetical protein
MKSAEKYNFVLSCRNLHIFIVCSDIAEVPIVGGMNGFVVRCMFLYEKLF